MDPILYNAMNGSQTDFNRQAISANNLANSGTVGFKSELFQAQSMYLTGSVATAEALVGEQVHGVDFTDGPLMTTGRDLDLAVQGDGWFAVQDSQGKEAYTRAGDFHVDENGMLMTASKHPVLGDGGPISIPPAQRIEIGSDGTISIVPLGAEPDELAVLDRIKLVKLTNKDLIKNNDGLMKLKGGGVALADASVVLVKGALEGSNVNPIANMVELINTGKEFEAQMKVMQTVDENAQKLAQLLQV